MIIAPEERILPTHPARRNVLANAPYPYMCVTARDCYLTGNPSVDALLNQRSTYNQQQYWPTSEITHDQWLANLQQQALHAQREESERRAQYRVLPGPIPSGPGPAPAPERPPDPTAISEAEHIEIDAYRDRARAHQADQIARIEALRAIVGDVHPQVVIGAAGAIASEPVPPDPESYRYEVFPGIPMPDWLGNPPRTPQEIAEAYEGGGVPIPEEERSNVIRFPVLDTPSGTSEPDLPDTRPGDATVDLSDIWDAVSRTVTGTFDFDPATPGIFGTGAGTSLPDLIGGALGVSRPGGPTGLVPGATTMPPTAGSGNIYSIATNPATGQQQLVARRRCRRRRRMLTKSDVADISTMKAILGNGEAFKTWLAKATR